MHGGDGGTTSHAKVFANILVCSIGAGVLGLPYAFRRAGILEGAIALTLVATLSVKAMLLLIASKNRVLEDRKVFLEHERLHAPAESVPKKAMISQRTVDYGDVADYAYGRKGRLAVEVSIIISQAGFCCGYLIFIAENLGDLIGGKEDLRRTLLICCLALVPVVLIRELKALAPLSLMADFAAIFAYCVVFYFDLEHIHEVMEEMGEREEINIAGLPFFLGVAIYCFEGAGMVLSLENTMAEEKRHEFPHLLKMTMVTVTSLYVSFGVCGYLSFGPHTAHIITLNLADGLFTRLIKTCLSFSMFFTYPVMIFPVVNILEQKMAGATAHPGAARTGAARLRGHILRVAIVFATATVVILIPDFATLMELIGSSCCTLLAFILPALLHLKLFEGRLSNADRLLNYLLIATGIVGSVLGTLDALERIKQL